VAQRIVQNAIGHQDYPFAWLGYEPFDPSVPPPPPEPERKTVKIDPAIFDAVVGQYEVRPGVVYFLETKDGHLVGSRHGKYWDDVMAVSETEFFIDGTLFVFTFSRDSDGTVTGLVISYQRMENFGQEDQVRFAPCWRP